MAALALLLASDPVTARAVSAALEAEGCAVATNPESGTGREYDLIVADLLPAGTDAGELCGTWNESAEELAVLTLDCGRDTRWLIAARLERLPSLDVVARVGIALRRLRRGGRPPIRSVAFDDVHVDFDDGRAVKAGLGVNLRAKELELLRRLVDESPAVIPREELLRTVWAYQDGVSTRTVDVHMSSLRRKLEDTPRRPRHLRSVRGVGYRFVP